MLIGEDAGSTRVQLWNVETEEPRKQWEMRAPVGEELRHEAIVSTISVSGEEKILFSVAPGPTFLLDPEDGSVSRQLEGMQNFDSMDGAFSENDVFALDTDRDLLARGERDRGVVHVVRLSRRDKWRRILKVPWGFERFWWVRKICFVGVDYLVVDFGANWQPFATVVYSLEDARIVWSEARSSIGDAVVSPSGEWVAYLKDGESLEVVRLPAIAASPR